MSSLFACILREHDLWIVLVAAFLCGVGSWVTARLFRRAMQTNGSQRVGWYVLTALATGVAIWCTHFIAMMGFRAGTSVTFDPFLTLLSLFICIVGSVLGFVAAGSKVIRWPSVVGGGLLGSSIAAMHYVGMMAFHVHGQVHWDLPYVVGSGILGPILAMAALHMALKRTAKGANAMAALFAAAILSVHFLGMTAFHVVPDGEGMAPSHSEAMGIMTMAVIGMSLIILVMGMVSYLIDDSTRAESIERLRRMALNDALTGLPNRANFNDRLDFEIALAAQRGSRLALIGIDLDRFKDINDLRGHSAGDEVLRVLGRRMKAMLNEESGRFIARTGGDEFTALYRIGASGDVSGFVSRIEQALSEPIAVENLEISSGGSLGVAIFPDDAVDRENLVNCADLAMYRAKSNPLQRVCFYEPTMDERIRERRALAADLRDAISHDQLALHYQVQTIVSTGNIRGYEALLRWQHPKLGQIPPSEFIPLAEENGLILSIGEWVLRTACREAATWEPPYTIAVNLSAVQFINADLPAVVRKVLAETGLAPERLELELTESTIFADRARSLDMLRQIRALGVSIALDDFGTGYSSLDTLRSFTFDRIKIDRSFFSSSAATAQTTAIIRAVLALGKSFGIPVMAEGIETYDQLSMLNAEGCEEAQGFLLGHPVTVDDIISKGQVARLKGGPDGPGAVDGTRAESGA
ncbi:putative bifunctional diguanylate cyclase/phosphodiesterase [Gluconacetobacter sp. Hr-1-5]|uniref:putative bifunctional diguanylate cyclase/phosphodiesterase n=1 Tax=Gluconacetobacter sp. Hr-1-5 TaxID=3395370 RepID=UPI003B5265E1